GQVFKVQANMDAAHRDRIAFVRICSGRFERGMVVTHAGTGRPFATKYAHQLFGRERTTAETAYPGDVVGLVNASALRPGETLYTGPRVTFPPIASFAPELFSTARPVDVQRAKPFRRGIAQLDAEGVVQVLRNENRGEQEPVLAAVGPMQFDVVRQRMEQEFRCAIELTPLPFSIVRRTDAAGAARLERERGVEVCTRAQDGATLALFTNGWRLEAVRSDHPEVLLEALVAGDAAAPA
ncbi:MAG: peptide chain release factor 3, partial [Candidatus Dormiibacterota bacterium]